MNNYINNYNNYNNNDFPKIIMQTYKDYNIPEKWNTSQISIQKYLPNWEYHFLTDKDARNFCKNYFPWFLKTYDNFPYNIQRVDALRPMWLYINGGIYMDMDYEIIDDNFEKLFNSNYNLFFTKSPNLKKYYTNSIMASKKNNPFWLYYLNEMTKKLPWYKKIGKHFNVMNSTGPIILTHLINKYNPNFKLLPSSKLTPCSICNINCDISNSYLKPLQGCSWISYDTKLYNIIICNYKHHLIYIFLFIFILIILFRFII